MRESRYTTRQNDGTNVQGQSIEAMPDRKGDEKIWMKRQLMPFSSFGFSCYFVVVVVVVVVAWRHCVDWLVVVQRRLEQQLRERHC